MDWPRSPHHGDTGRRVHGQVAVGMGDHPSLQHSRAGCTWESCTGPERRLPPAASLARLWQPVLQRQVLGPEHRCHREQSLLSCVCLSVSVCLCTCACLCLCAQPAKVTVRERCQQPRNGLGMESVSQIGTQGRPEASRSSPSVVTVSICATAGVGPDEMSPPGAGQGACPGGFGKDRGQEVPGGAMQVVGAWLQGSEEETAGGREGLSLCPCATVSGLLVARCPSHLPLVSPLTAALCSLQGRGGQHPSAGEAAGHCGESLLRPASPRPQAVTCSTWGRHQRGGGCRCRRAGAAAQPQTGGPQQLNEDSERPVPVCPCGGSS